MYDYYAGEFIRVCVCVYVCEPVCVSVFVCSMSLGGSTLCAGAARVL